jgi:hypothetical protein
MLIEAALEGQAKAFKVVVTTGTPPLTRFFGPRKNRGKGKPR